MCAHVGVTAITFLSHIFISICIMRQADVLHTCIKHVCTLSFLKPTGEMTGKSAQPCASIPSTFHSLPDVSPGYQAAQLNESRVSLACYLKSLRSYSNTQLLWCKQRQPVTHYYRYGVYKNATLTQCMLCMMIKNSV